MGIAAIQDQSIQSNGDVLNVGTITLDGNALSILASNPTDGTTGVATNQLITVSFSEALSGTGGIFVSSANGNVPPQYIPIG